MLWLVALLLTTPPAGDSPASVRAATDAPALRALSPVGILESDRRRIRAGNARLAALMRDGARRSVTFGALITAIQQTGLIVYVEQSFGLPAGMQGRVLLQAVTGRERYLRIQLRATLQGNQMIAVMAHELRHAIEVAEHPAVRDQEGMLDLYRRIGHASHGSLGYDTEAANAVGRLVRSELIG